MKQFEFLSIKRRVERAAHNYDSNHDALIDDAEAAIAAGKEVDEGPGEKVVIHTKLCSRVSTLGPEASDYLLLSWLCQ